MGGEPLDDIMGYLGLGPTPELRPAVKTGGAEAAVVLATGANGTLLASAEGCTLWLMSNENADWIELRGRFATARATRPKARLLLDVEESLRDWAAGGGPKVRSRDLSVCPMRKQGEEVLEIKFKAWKPLRLSRKQAQALLALFEPVKVFASS